jgi:hypothetical protein
MNVAADLSEIRERIVRKSREYFVFDRMAHEKRNMFHGAMDALLDAGMAAASYGRAFSADTGVDLLICYGFLQAIYIQQDAVRTLCEALELKWHPNDDEQLKKLREARNRLTGHPSKAGKRPNLSSAIIPYHDISKTGFRGHVYYTDDVDDIFVEASLFLKKNEENLANQMLVVEETMDRQEREFRRGQKDRKISASLEGSFSYLLQRLHCDLSDNARVPQAQAHACMIRSIFGSLRQELNERGFGTPEIFDNIKRLASHRN